MKLEKDYQAQLIKRIKKTFPDAIVLKNDSSYTQGIPDLSILCKDKYAMLEVKRCKDAPRRPNQDYYLEKFGTMGAYASYIWPESEHIVMEELINYFGIKGAEDNAV